MKKLILFAFILFGLSINSYAQKDAKVKKEKLEKPAKKNELREGRKGMKKRTAQIEKAVIEAGTDKEGIALIEAHSNANKALKDYRKSILSKIQAADGENAKVDRKKFAADEKYQALRKEVQDAKQAKHVYLMANNEEYKAISEAREKAVEARRSEVRKMRKESKKARQRTKKDMDKAKEMQELEEQKQ